MMIGKRRYLRGMSYADYLRRFGNLVQLNSDLLSRLSGYSGINLVGKN